MQKDLNPSGQHGAGREVACRRQGLVAEQWLCGDPPARSQDWGQIELLEPFKAAAVGENHNIYDIIPDSKNNAYFTDIAAESNIGKVDPKDTMKVTLFQLPRKPGSGPRRGYDGRPGPDLVRPVRGNRSACSTPRPRRSRNGGLADAWWSNPYDVSFDKNDHTTWTGSMINDRVVRLDTKTGEFTEFLLPKTTNIRRVFVDNSTTPPARSGSAATTAPRSLNSNRSTNFWETCPCASRRHCLLRSRPLRLSRSIPVRRGRNPPSR